VTETKAAQIGMGNYAVGRVIFWLWLNQPWFALLANPQIKATTGLYWLLL
jgi:hypothetical protein